MYAYIRQGPVINQELVPSGHFIQVVEMRTNDSKNITATVMRQSFVRPCVYACVCVCICICAFPSKSKRTNRHVGYVSRSWPNESFNLPLPVFLPVRYDRRYHLVLASIKEGIIGQDIVAYTVAIYESAGE